MAYTSKVNSEKYNSPFPTRLRDLIDRKGCTQKALAEHLGITSQAIGAYCRGETKPTLEYAQAIADYFSVSLDYLSGRSEISSRDDNLHISHNATGLSESALNRLKCAEDPYGIISKILESDYFYTLIANIIKSIDVQESQIVRFTREITTELITAMGATGTFDLASGFSNSQNYEAFDQYVSMLSTLAPNRIALSREDAARFYIQEAQNNFKSILDEITK